MKGPVFFCDDDASIRTSLQQALELEDVPVRCFATGQGLLEALEPDWPGVVISDINMPGNRGLELIEELPRIAPGVPVILLTGYHEGMTRDKARAMGIKDFLMKPVKLKEFSAIIREVLDHQG